MAVYVDDMQAPHLRYVMSHMIADTDEELRSMADRIGVSQRHHQGDHFDIAKSKRALAVAAGAIEITQRQCAAMRARRRATGRLGSPDTALNWFRAFRGTPRPAINLPSNQDGQREHEELEDGGNRRIEGDCRIGQ